MELSNALDTQGESVLVQGRNRQTQGPRLHLPGKQTQETGGQDRALVWIRATSLRSFPGGWVGVGTCRSAGHRGQTGKGDRDDDSGGCRVTNNKQCVLTPVKPKLLGREGRWESWALTEP